MNLEFAFGVGGGLRRIAFFGNAKLMTKGLPAGIEKLTAGLDKITDPIAKLDSLADGSNNKLIKSIIPSKPDSSEKVQEELEKEGPDGQLGASWLVEIDLDSGTFFANFSILVNVGNGAMKGIMDPSGKAGEAVIFFGPGEWYVHAGTPTNPNGINILNLVVLQAYLMVGDNIPAFPPMPDQVLGFSDVSTTDLGDGKGLAFGARVSIESKERQFALFYSSFWAGLGFDIMFKKFYEPKYCVGMVEAMGVNNWYMQGQAFAYVGGVIGMRAKLFGKVRKFEIASITASVGLLGKGPNPSFFQGAMSIKYRILNGLIKGQGTMKLTLGEECVPRNGGLLANINVIEELTPSQNEQDVSVFTQPQAILNLPIEQSFSIIMDEETGETQEFKPILKSFIASRNGVTLAGHTSMNYNKDIIAFSADEILPPNSTIVIRVTVGFQYNRWKPLGRLYRRT